MGETISLSNIPIKRVIEIKKIETDTTVEEQSPSQLEQIQQLQNEIYKLENKRAQLITDTENEIKQLRNNWEQEKAQLIAQTKEIGYEAGFEEGKKESLEQYQQLIEQANSLIVSAKQDYYKTIEKSEGTILQLAVQIAEKIMKHKLTEQPEFFMPIVRAAIKEIQDQLELIIYLHPANYDYVLAEKQELERLLDSKADLSIRINEGLAEGSCIIEHPFGKIDASIKTQLSQIHHVLQELMMEKSE